MTQVNKERTGAWCAVISKQLAIAVCPLTPNSCVWQHRKTGRCCASPDNTEIRIGELATLVGAPGPNDFEVSNIKTELLKAVRNALRS